MHDQLKPGLRARGRVRAHQVFYDPRDIRAWWPSSRWQHNDFLYEWGALVTNLLARRGLNYGIGGMYIEFTNTASPGDPVAPPTFSRDADQGVAYYNDLSTSPDSDYLRVPLVTAIVDISDEVKYPNGNILRCFAQTSGVSGVHGKPFSDANNSVVIGGALVAFVDETDHTRDLVLSRFYFEVADQQPKLATSQIGLEWPLTFE